MSIKDIIANIAIISMSASILWHFSNIWRYEQCSIGEPSIIIRSIETGWFLFILAFGVGKFIGDLRRGRKDTYDN